MIKKIKEFLKENVTKDVEKVINELLFILKEPSECRNDVIQNSVKLKSLFLIEYLIF